MLVQARVYEQVIQESANRSANLGPYDINPKAVLRTRDSDASPAGKSGDYSRSKVSRRVPARLRERGVQRDEHRHGESNVEGHHFLRLDELVTVVGERQDDEHEDGGAPRLDHHGERRVDGQRGQQLVARVGKVLAKGARREHGARRASLDVVDGFKVGKRRTEHEQVEGAAENAARVLREPVRQQLGDGEGVRAEDGEGERHGGVEVRAGHAVGGQNGQGDAEAPHDGDLPQPSLRLGHDGGAHAAHAEDDDEHGADALGDALVQQGGLAARVEAVDEAQMRGATGRGRNGIGEGVVGVHDDGAGLEVQGGGLEVVDLGDEGEGVGGGGGGAGDVALQGAGGLVALAADGDGAEGAHGVGELVAVALEDGGEAGEADALGGGDGVDAVRRVGEGVVAQRVAARRERRAAAFGVGRAHVGGRR